MANSKKERKIQLSLGKVCVPSDKRHANWAKKGQDLHVSECMCGKLENHPGPNEGLIC
jgi:hypothetical protein